MQKFATPLSVLVLAFAVVWAAHTIRPVRHGDCNEIDREFVNTVMVEPYSRYNPTSITDEGIHKLKNAREKAKDKLIAMGFGGCLEVVPVVRTVRRQN